jgi:hypothetical protein
MPGNGHHEILCDTDEPRLVSTRHHSVGRDADPGDETRRHADAARLAVRRALAPANRPQQ